MKTYKYSSKETSDGYEQPSKVRPFKIPEQGKIINYPTAEDLATRGELPALKPPALQEGQKYADPGMIAGVVSVAVIDRTPADLDAEQTADRQMMVVSPRQIRLALNQLGWRDQVEVAVAAGDQDTKDGWEFATSFERLYPLVVSLGQGIGKTCAEMDQLFELAATL